MKAPSSLALGVTDLDATADWLATFGHTEIARTRLRREDARRLHDIDGRPRTRLLTVPGARYGLLSLVEVGGPQAPSATLVAATRGTPADHEGPDGLRYCLAVPERSSLLDDPDHHLAVSEVHTVRCTVADLAVARREWIQAGFIPVDRPGGAVLFTTRSDDPVRVELRAGDGDDGPLRPGSVTLMFTTAAPAHLGGVRAASVS